MNTRRLILFVGILAPFILFPIQAGSPAPFTFVVTADMREFAGPGMYDTAQYFRGALESITAHSPDSVFMVSPGDIDPPVNVRWSITQTLGVDYRWYPIAGNHEVETLADMEWLRAFDYGAVNPGPAGCPATTYSLDYRQAHFVMLNEYCDSTGDVVTAGDIPDHLYNWLAADLLANSGKMIFVFGHEPAYPQPDAGNGRLRHDTDSLNQYADHRDRFWQLLKDRQVTAYICGHTHNYSAVRIDGVWQLDAGHARGLGDTGARSTYILVRVSGLLASFTTYRDDANGGLYTKMDEGVLSGLRIYFPILSVR